MAIGEMVQLVADNLAADLCLEFYMLDQQPQLLAPEVVFERTRAGQCQILTSRVALSPLESRLLAIMTGFTKLEDLLALLGESELPHAAVDKLLQAGFIKPVQARTRMGADTQPMWKGRPHSASSLNS